MEVEPKLCRALNVFSSWKRRIDHGILGVPLLFSGTLVWQTWNPNCSYCSFKTMNRWVLVITKFDYWRARQQIGWGLLAHAPRHTGPSFDSVSIAVLLCFAEVQCSAAECARHSVFVLEASSLVFYLIFAIQHLYELTGMLLPSSTVENVARSSYSLPDEKWTYATAAKWVRSGCCSKTWFEGKFTGNRYLIFVGKAMVFCRLWFRSIDLLEDDPLRGCELSLHAVKSWKPSSPWLTEPFTDWIYFIACKPWYLWVLGLDNKGPSCVLR